MKNPFLLAEIQLKATKPHQKATLYDLAVLFQSGEGYKIETVAEVIGRSVDVTRKTLEWVAEHPAAKRGLKRFLCQNLQINVVEDKDKMILWVEQHAPSIQRMREPLTNEDCKYLRAKFKVDQLVDVFTRMHSYTKLGNNRNAKLTAIKWLEKDKTKNSSAPRGATNRTSDILG